MPIFMCRVRANSAAHIGQPPGRHALQRNAQPKPVAAGGVVRAEPPQQQAYRLLVFHLGRRSKQKNIMGRADMFLRQASVVFKLIISSSVLSFFLFVFIFCYLFRLPEFGK